MSPVPSSVTPEPDAEGWPPADAATRLGQLQRGLGSGARLVLANGAEASADVLSCIANDPRWDRQLDTRADFYARLLGPAGIEIGELAELLETHHSRASPDDRDRAPIVLSVLERLIDFGDLDALHVLQGHAERGAFWADAVEALTYQSKGELRGDWEQHTAVIPSALDARWPTTAELAAALGTSWQVEGDRQPWSSWAQSHPPFAEALRLRDAATHSSRRRPDFARMATSELLEHDNQSDVNPLARELIKRTSPADTRAMLVVAADLSSPMYAAAACALAERGRTESLPAIHSLNAGLRPGVQSTLRRAFRELPAQISRPIARQWLGFDPDPSRRSAGASIFSEHSLPQEIPFLLAMLTRELDAKTDGSQYIICDLAQALERHPDAGPHPELDRAFHEMIYSFGRHFVADAIAATDPDFPTTLALHCLWDSEERIRELGATAVDRHLPDAAERLKQLANDPDEDPTVRAAALRDQS